MISRWFAALFLCFATVGNANDSNGDRQLVNADAPSGRDYQPCDECPTFVRAPSAPTRFRPIQYVAAHELTWRHYFASVDEETCPVPQSFVETWPNEEKRSRMIDKYRVDWPAAYLSIQEVSCYITWISEKTALSASLPTPEEWEWFASAGDEGARFPWGQNAENPPAAVEGVEIDVADRWPADFHGYGDRDLIAGVRVGMFPPSKWGLYDLIGNTPELTNKTESGADHMVHRRNRQDAEYLMQFNWVLLKGGGMAFDDWRDGIGVENWTYIDGGMPKTSVSVRLVLIAKHQEPQNTYRPISISFGRMADNVQRYSDGDPEIGQPIRDCDVCPPIVAIPDIENPSSRMFVMSHELTWADYVPSILEDDCAKPIISRGKSYPENLNDLADRYPLTMVPPTKIDCYLNWLEKRSGYRYRLPTSDEWEHAARAGTQTRFPWGDTPGEGRAAVYTFWDPENVRDSLPISDDPRFLLGSNVNRFPVGLFRPNGWGLYDVVGNVWEYVDANIPGPEGCLKTQNENYCTGQIARGGAWSSVAYRVGKGLIGRDLDYMKAETVRIRGHAQPVGYRFVRDVR